MPTPSNTQKWAWIDAACLTVTDACIEWPWARRNGYGAVRRGPNDVDVHVHVCEAAHGPRPDGMFACHSCDNRPCCNPAHLYWGTPDDNVADRMRLRGQRKLTDDEIAAIRAAYVGKQHRWRPRTGPTLQELATQYGVGLRRIFRIVGDK